MIKLTSEDKLYVEHREYEKSFISLIIIIFLIGLLSLFEKLLENFIKIMLRFDLTKRGKVKYNKSI